MKHLGLWLFSIGIGITIGGFVGSIFDEFNWGWEPTIIVFGWLLSLVSLIIIWGDGDAGYLS